MPETKRQIRVAIDVGGTFTDFALATADGVSISKVLTTHHAPEQGILAGLSRLMADTRVEPGEVDFVVHGTTLATNAVIARTGARTALITTQGFRDVLALGDESRFDQYDLSIDKPAPLVPRRWRFCVAERMSAVGEILVPLDMDVFDALAEQLQRDGIASVAICFLHSHVNSLHEEQARRRLQELLPDAQISISSEVSPEIGEYERFSTTTANAYVQPIIADYLSRFEAGLRERGLAAPVFMFLSNGGLCQLETARKFPIRLVESGPAGGAMFAGYVAEQCRADRILAFDMGGTTAKICLIDDARPGRSDRFEMARQHLFRQGSGIPVRIPVIELVEIGAGGGSIASIDALRRLKVGPASAGAEPGPACYDQGGTRPTVTDANLLLGRLSASDFQRSGIGVSTDLAERSVQQDIAGPLELTTVSGAQAIVAMVEENMANAAREHTREKGSGLRDRTMIAFGGGAPVHAAHVAAKLGIERVIIPHDAGIGSAIGFLVSPFSFEVSRSVFLRLPLSDPAAFNATVAELAERAHDVVRHAAPSAPTVESRLALMRYVGQGHHITVELPETQLAKSDSAALLARFEQAYIDRYKRPLENLAVECVGVRVQVSRSVAAELPPAVNIAADQRAQPESRYVGLFDASSGAFAQVPTYDRDALSIAQLLTGPALIKEYGTTTVVPQGFTAVLDDWRNLVLTRTGS
jgi:N-methylhydantoinase A